MTTGRGNLDVGHSKTYGMLDGRVYVLDQVLAKNIPGRASGDTIENPGLKK